MTLRPYAPRLATELARLYNEMIACVPETCPVPEEWFADPKALRSTHCAVGTQTLTVAEEGGVVVGFVHVGLAPPPTEDWHPKEAVAIRALVYRPGHRRSGQALLGWAETWAREHGRREVMAWHALYGYPCQSPWTHLSDRVGHVRALFGMAGYEPRGGQVYLTWRDYTPPPVPPLEVECEVTGEWQEGFTGPRWLLTARQGSTWLGECRMDRGHISPVPQAEDWCYCAGLNVIEAFQGHRLGVHLLARGLQEMHAVGCRHADISTLGDNYRAELLYANLGYEWTDYSEAWRKDLGWVGRGREGGEAMPADVTLRRAVSADYEAVSELAVELSDVEADRRAAFEATLAHPDRALLVAEAGGEVVGFADVLVYPDVTEGGMAAELMGLIVRADQRRQGIGRALVEEACRVAAGRGVGEFHICTEPENHTAQRLYAACGAKVVGVQMEIELGE